MFWFVVDVLFHLLCDFFYVVRKLRILIENLGFLDRRMV
jgi:hypothetical protein